MRKWKCVEDNEGKFTKGKIYTTRDDGRGLESDNGETGWIRVDTMFIVASFEEVFEEKEEDKNEI